MTVSAPIAQGASDVASFTRRNLLRYQRLPDAIVALVVQPLLVLFIFRYILGGAIHLRTGSYVDFLVPGLLAFAVINGSTAMSIGLAEDLTSGAVARYGGLPVARSAFVMAHTFTDLLRNLFVVPVVFLVSVAVGFSMHASVPAVLLAYVLLLALGFSFAWLSTIIALCCRTVDATQALVILLFLIAGFASSAFVPVDAIAPWLRDVVNASPVTHVINAVRELLTGSRAQADILPACLWLVAIPAVAAPVAVALQAWAVATERHSI